jgi:hypothetical protein
MSNLVVALYGSVLDAGMSMRLCFVYIQFIPTFLGPVKKERDGDIIGTYSLVKGLKQNRYEVRQNLSLL